MKKQITITIDEQDQQRIKNFATQNRESLSSFMVRSSLIRMGEIEQ